MIEIRELKNSKSQQRTKRAENLQKHSRAAILPTDAFELQIYAHKKARLLVLRKTFLYQLKEERCKSFFFSRSIVNKPVNYQFCIKGKQKRYFVGSF